MVRVGIRDELEKTSIRVSEVDARPLPASSIPLYGADLDRDSQQLEMLDRFLDGARPHETEIAVPRLDWLVSYEVTDVDAGAVNVELLIMKSVSASAIRMVHDLSSYDVS